MFTEENTTFNNITPQRHSARQIYLGTYNIIVIRNNKSMY